MCYTIAIGKFCCFKIVSELYCSLLCIMFQLLFTCSKIFSFFKFHLTNSDLLSWPGGYYTPGYGLPIHIDNARCVGNEDLLVNCPYSNPSSSDNHNKDAGVRCFPVNGSDAEDGGE